MMQLTRRALVLGSSALAGTAIAASPSHLRAARAVVGNLLAADSIPALSIAVTCRDQLIWAEAFGMVNLELHVAATPAHRFRLGSVSKVVTATLAAKLAANGSIDLDAPISQYMPDLPTPHRATTLRLLLTHRGGIRHYADKDWSLEAPGPIDRRQYLSSADVLAVFINDPLIAPPGTQVLYSTFGYTLASLVMEAATNTSFLDLIQREIAIPLSLESLVGDAPAAIVPQRVSGYQSGDVTRKALPGFTGKLANIVQSNPAYKWAGGGLLATPTDLARFGAAHLAPGKLSREALQILFTVYTPATDRSPPLGLGWRIDTDNRGRTRWHHAGGQDGARASLMVYPAQELSIAFATNITGLPGDVLTPSSSLADAFAQSHA
jgi:serine beta-lactamase-like protein LACTB